MRARSATLRRQMVNVPARNADPRLHMPERWPWRTAWHRLHHTVFGTGPAHQHRTDLLPIADRPDQDDHVEELAQAGIISTPRPHLVDLWSK